MENENIEVVEKKKTTARRAPKEKTAEETQPEQESSPAPARKIVAKDIDPTQYVTVRNGFQGQLVYKSPRTGERFVWDGFGSEQLMELRELKNAKNTHKKLFTNNWFMFDKDEDWIVDYLGVGQFYKHALSIDHFDDIFKKKPSELKKAVELLSPGQKKSVAYRAKELIANKEIDSLSVIDALEEALGIDLIEK